MEQSITFRSRDIAHLLKPTCSAGVSRFRELAFDPDPVEPSLLTGPEFPPMINDVVIHNAPLRIATGTFVCMFGDPSGAACSTCGFDSDSVVHGGGDALGAAEVALGRLY
jgi:hypothetical protein